MIDFITLLKGEYCGLVVPTSFRGVFYERDKEYEFFFFKNSDNKYELSLDHRGHGKKIYDNMEEFFKDWRNVSAI